MDKNTQDYLTSTNTPEKITYRKKLKTNLVDDMCHMESSPLLEDTIVSLPNSSIQEESDINHLFDKIKELEKKLDKANCEIENLNSKNNILERELIKINELLRLHRNNGNSENIDSTLHQSGQNKNYIRTYKENLTRTGCKISSGEGPDKIKQNNISSKTLTKNKRNPDKVSENSQINNMSTRGKKIIIVADQQGRNLQSTLQTLVGREYSVSCTWKSGARLKNILSNSDKQLQELDKDDYIVILGGTNDRNPYEIQLCLNSWLSKFENTNVILCEVPYNQFLIEKKLNYQLKFLCTKYNHVGYLDMDFSRYMPKPGYYPLYISRMILRDVLRLSYHHKYDKYNNNFKNKITKCDVSTQTDNILETKDDSLTNIMLNQENVEYNDNTNMKNNNLFRV